MKMDAFIAQLVASREITMKELTERLGYRSKTSITRIAKGKANLRSMEEFDKRVRDALNPTPAEGECLERLLESARWKNDYYASQEMRAFFFGGGVIWRRGLPAQLFGGRVAGGSASALRGRGEDGDNDSEQPVRSGLRNSSNPDSAGARARPALLSCE